MNDEDIQFLLNHREEAMMMLDKLDAEDSLLNFSATLWPVIEPGRMLVRGKALDAICEHLEAVSKGHIRKLLINVPPGCMKSLSTCVLWPAWEWGPQNRPDLRYVCASYSQDLTIRDNRRCRQVIGSPAYQAMWGDRFKIDPTQDAKTKFENDKRGWKIATSVGGAVVGERGDRFIIDDPHNIKVVESDRIRDATLQWFAEVVPTRVTDPEKACFVCIMQRVHERDVSGLILAKEMGYEHLCLPMEYEVDHPNLSRNSIGFRDWRAKDGELLWPERFTKRYVEELKESLRSWGGSYAEAGQLQQRPTPRGGGMFQRDDFRILDIPPAVDDGLAVRSWDLAASEGGGDWTVGSKVRLTRDKRVVIEDVIRVQLGPGDVDDLIQRTAERDGHWVRIIIPQDPGSAGKALSHSIIKRLQGFITRASPQTGSKTDRARPLASQSEIGNLYVVRGHWNDPFINEMAVFDKGAHDDQVDSVSQGYAELVLFPDMAMTGESALAGAPKLLRLVPQGGGEE